MRNRQSSEVERRALLSTSHNRTVLEDANRATGRYYMTILVAVLAGGVYFSGLWDMVPEFPDFVRGAVAHMQ